MKKKKKKKPSISKGTPRSFLERLDDYAEQVEGDVPRIARLYLELRDRHERDLPQWKKMEGMYRDGQQQVIDLLTKLDGLSPTGATLGDLLHQLETRVLRLSEMADQLRRIKASIQ